MNAVKFLDKSVSWAGDRSIRELIVLTAGLALCVGEYVRPGGPDVGNFIVYVLAVGLFAVRAYFARAAAVGACVGAIAQQWPHLRHGHVDVETLAIFPIVAIALLASSDLVQRFERSPSSHRWLPNQWANFTDKQTRTIRWSVYTAGALGGLLDHILQLSRNPLFGEMPMWPRVCMIAIVVFAGLLVLGRAIGLLGLWATCLTVAVLMAPHAWVAERAMAGASVPASARTFFGADHYITPAFLLAVLTVLTATPFVFRLLRRTLFDAGPSQDEAGAS